MIRTFAGEVVLSACQEKFGEIKDRVVVTTDEGSKLWALAKQKEYDVLAIPKLVGGRYSVLSAVGQFPLSCCGVEIKALLEGAEEMANTCLGEDITQNPAALSAIITYHHSQQEKNINDTFFFLPQLESIGKWYRQLMGESLGKEHDLQGNVVHAGITPTVSIGSTDLHSVGQLYLGGPHDKMTTFVYNNLEKKESQEIEETSPTSPFSYSTRQNEFPLPSTLEFPLVEGIAGRHLSDIMNAIYQGVKIAYQKQGLPFMEVLLDINEKTACPTERSLGEFLQFKMIEMMYLGELLNVNAFDQPHVELYKVETKKILNK